MENKVEDLLCMSCLCFGRTLTDISHAKHKEHYLRMLGEIPMYNTFGICPRICWECEAILKRTIAFEEQVKDSYRILQTYTNENLREYLLTDVSRPPHLKIYKNPPVDITPLVDDEWSVKYEDKVLEVELPSVKSEETLHNKANDGKEVLIYIKDEDEHTSKEVKEEKELSDLDEDWYQDYSDGLGNFDTKLSEIIRKSSIKVSKSDKKKKTPKENKENKIKKVKKVIKSLQSTSKKDVRRAKKPETQQKIRIIDLSYDEMLQERSHDSIRENYLKSDFKCEDCLLGFSFEKSYKEHLAAKHSPGLGDYSCPICKTFIASVESFTAHYKRHMRRFECCVCGKRTMDRKVLTQHYESTHDQTVREYKCPICGKISNSIDAHRYHKDTHKARVECSECDKTFSHRAGLMNHRLVVHKLNNAFPCTFCDKVFRWKTSLKKHIEKHERKGKEPDNAPICEPCGISFSSICTYQRHLKNSLKHVTENELKFICNECNRKFANKTKIRDHIEEKHLNRTYQCPICLKPSKNRVCLDQHIRNIHKGRPNNKMCHHCGKGFPTKVQLDSHIRSHTGERPFICEFCPTTFSQQSNLYKHNRQVHMNIKAKRYPMCRKRKDKSSDGHTGTTSFEVFQHRSGVEVPFPAERSYVVI